MLGLFAEVWIAVDSASDVLSPGVDSEVVLLGDFTIVVVGVLIVGAVWLFAKMARVGDVSDGRR